MPYRLIAGESVRDGLVRVIGGEVDFAIKQLGARAADRDRGIHEARKSIKKIRAVIRLTSPWLGAPGEGHDLLLGNAARALSASRDAAALIETIAGLRARFGHEAGEKDFDRVQKALAPSNESPHDERRRTATVLRRFRRELAECPALHDDFSALAGGWKRTYRQGKETLELCRSEPLVENFHKLRRRVKGHWYHVRLLEGVWPVPMQAREKCLKELQEWLGDDHNLALLDARPEADPIRGLIDVRQRELREESLALAAKIYAERPRDHVRRIAKLWELWKG